MLLMRWCIALLLLFLAACQAAPPPPPSSPQGVKHPGALAAEALEHGDYARAAELYRKALAAEPESLPLHYGLGVSASYLERRAEAVRELIWVLERGNPGSSEVRVARRWLSSVGALPRSAPAAPGPAGEEPRDVEQSPAHASLHGRVMFGETPREVAPMERMQLFLIEHPSRVKYYRLRTDEQGRFRFANVPPGIYKLTNRTVGQPTWQLRVELKAGQDVTLDLSPANSTGVRDDFPESTPAVGPRS